MANLTAQKITDLGIVETLASATSTGDEFVNSGIEFIHIQNNHGSASRDVTITAQVTNIHHQQFGRNFRPPGRCTDQKNFFPNTPQSHLGGSQWSVYLLHRLGRRSRPGARRIRRLNCCPNRTQFRWNAVQCDVGHQLRFE